MTIEKLERVMWRIRKDYPNQHPSWNELDKAIMKEIGVDRRTQLTNRRALKKLEWIKPYGKKRFMLTDKDLTDN
jgi:predicted transcriptional regulator